METAKNPFFVKPPTNNTNKNSLIIYRDMGDYKSPEAGISSEELPLLIEALTAYERGLNIIRSSELDMYRKAQELAASLRSDFNGLYRSLCKSEPGNINEVSILDRPLTEQLRLLFPAEVEYTKKVNTAVETFVDASDDYTDDCIYSSYGLYPFLKYNEFHYRNPQENEKGHFVLDLSTLLSSCIDLDSFMLWVDDLEIGKTVKEQLKSIGKKNYTAYERETLSVNYIKFLNAISGYLSSVSDQKKKDMAVIKALEIDNAYTIKCPDYFRDKELKNKIRRINKKVKNKQLILVNENGNTKVICRFRLPF